MNSLDEMLKAAVGKKASDIFFVVGQPICYKIGGQIVRDHDLEYDWDRGLSAGTCQQWIQQLYDTANRDMSYFVNNNDDDFAVSIPGAGRFRVNVFKQRGTISAVLRAVPFGLPPFENMGIPNSILNIASLKKGLVLVTGTAGSGKSTTLAYIIDKINHERECHILTLEDPIEYLHRHDKSIISQREIAIDTESYSSALRAALREAPDVILIGEMRDRDTIETAIIAAETGHLVFATLHTGSASDAVDRIVQVFEEGKQTQIRLQLSMVLQAVVTQQLLPRKGGGRILACEMMIVTDAIRNLIRAGNTPQIVNAIATGGSIGNQSMDQCLIRMVRNGGITREVALRYARDKDYVKKNAV